MSALSMTSKFVASKIQWNLAVKNGPEIGGNKRYQLVIIYLYTLQLCCIMCLMRQKVRKARSPPLSLPLESPQC